MESDPFRHVVIDDYITPELAAAACAEWPSKMWPGWLYYANGHKLASRGNDLPTGCLEVLRAMFQIPVSELLGIDGTWPDTSLYGGGLHWIPCDGHLPCHVDADHHPVTKWERRASAVLFVSNCAGGELCLGADESVVLTPRRSRLVVFECGDTTYHSVRKVEAGERMTCAVFFWSNPRDKEYVRPRAKFGSP